MRSHFMVLLSAAVAIAILGISAVAMEFQVIEDAPVRRKPNAPVRRKPSKIEPLSDAPVRRHAEEFDSTVPTQGEPDTLNLADENENIAQSMKLSDGTVVQVNQRLMAEMNSGLWKRKGKEAEKWAEEVNATGSLWKARMQRKAEWEEFKQDLINRRKEALMAKKGGKKKGKTGKSSLMSAPASEILAPVRRTSEQMDVDLELDVNQNGTAMGWRRRRRARRRDRRRSRRRGKKTPAPAPKGSGTAEKEPTCSKSKCDKAKSECINSRKSKQGKTGCVAFTEGWKEGENDCTDCSATSKARKAGDLKECQDACGELYAGDKKSWMRTKCKFGCSEAKKRAGEGKQCVCCDKGAEAEEEEAAEEAEAVPVYCEQDAKGCKMNQTCTFYGTLNEASTAFDTCQGNIAGIAGHLGTINEGVGKLREVFEKLGDATGALKDFMALITNNINKGGIMGPPATLAKLIGKIPKIGALIEIGLVTAQKIASFLEKISGFFEKMIGKFETAIGFVQTIFEKTVAITAPVSEVMQKTLAVLNELVNCGQVQSSCSSGVNVIENAAAALNQPSVAVVFGVITNASGTCHQGLAPVEATLLKVAEASEAIAYFLDPTQVIFDVVAKVINLVKAKVDEIVGILTEKVFESPLMKCMMDVFAPVTDAINLVSCPVDEGIAGLLHIAVSAALNATEEVIDDMSEDLITKAVDALIPDDFVIEVPNFMKDLPDWVDVGKSLSCKTANSVWPEHKEKVEAAMAFELPFRMTAKEAEDLITKYAVAATRVSKLVETYDSACVAAYQKLSAGYEFNNCKGIFDGCIFKRECVLKDENYEDLKKNGKLKPRGSFCIPMVTCNLCSKEGCANTTKASGCPTWPSGERKGMCIDSCSNTWWGGMPGANIIDQAPGIKCGKEPRWPDGTKCVKLGHINSCVQCQNSSTWWHGDGPNRKPDGTTVKDADRGPGDKCGREPKWPKGTICVPLVTCGQCKNKPPWWESWKCG